MSFGGLVLTGRGREEIAKAAAGEVLLKIQEVVLGEGLYEGAYKDAVSLVNSVMNLQVGKISREGDEIHLEVEFSSQDVPRAFYYREIGIMANDVLCYYDNCGEAAEYIDPDAENIIKQKRIRIVLNISSEVNVNVSAASQLYAMEEDFLEHKNNHENPHSVTKEQIGLGRADNTADNEKPVSTAQQELINATYQQLTRYTDVKIADLINGAPETLDTLKEIADAMADNQDVVEALDEAIGKKVNTNGGDISDTIAEFTEAPSLEEPQSGEMVKTIFGKLKLAVKNLKTLITLIGTTDISSIGGGTVTGAISALNSNLSNKADIIGKSTLAVQKEISKGDLEAFSKANFVAEKPLGSQNACGYGFHNIGTNGAFLYYEIDGYLHILRSDGTNAIIPTQTELEKISVGGNLKITWAQDGSTGVYYLRFFIGDTEVAAIKQGSVLG